MEHGSMPLTDTAIRNAKIAAKPCKLSKEQGLFLIVNPTGSKLWRLAYTFYGKEKLLSLGGYPEITLTAAHERRDEAHRLLANGIDPSQHRQQEKTREAVATSNSFESVARERYAKHSPGWAPSHADKLIRRFQSDVFPWIGSRPVSEIEPPELLGVLRRIEARGAVDTAHRTHQNCGQVFRYAIATGRAARNPAAA
jgi:hypothetical protein